MRSIRFLLCLLFLWPYFCLAHPADSYRFHSVESERRAMALARELRCPQCQNQNLMESNSVIAMDLRLEVYRQVDGGKSNEQVVQYMTDRFGDFVLYNPRFRAGTLLLWGMPAILLISALWLLLRAHSRNGKPPPPGGEKADISEESPPRTATPPALGGRNAVPVIVIIAATLALVVGGYAQSGRWQLSEYWRRNPDPLLTMDGDSLKDASFDRLRTKLRNNPRDVESWAELAQLHTYRDQYTLALGVYDRIAAIEGTLSASTAAAKATVLYYQSGQRLTPQAKELLDKALALDPGEVTALMLLASDYFLQAQYPEAIAIWQKLLDEERPRINREQLIRAIRQARQLAG